MLTSFYTIAFSCEARSYPVGWQMILSYWFDDFFTAGFFTFTSHQ